jgi:hypothetical protein
MRDVTTADLSRLVTDAELAAAATEVRAEIAAMPPPEQIAERLAGLV